jgi:lipid-binding SYLF domain-containing protein
MKTMFRVFMLLALGAAVLQAASDQEQLHKAANVLSEIMRTPDRGIPDDLLRKSVCVGIVPSQLKAAFIFGGTYGRGVMVCRTHGNGSWGAPSMFGLGGASFGFQIGGEATDVVFLVMNPEGAKKLLQDDVKLGGDVSAAAGPVGRTMEGSTDAQLHAEILSYSRARGLFAGVSLEGSVLKQDHDGNRRLYHQEVTARDILIRGSVASPPEAWPIDRLLTKHAPHGGAPFRES